MIWSNALLFCLVFIWASGEPDPNVNVKINVNVNGESEESTESGISCNLVWNQEEHRPLIMIRENKEIVPPILNTRISDNPNRVPLGLKLVFACPGHSNKFIQIEGNHTKLHGECVEPDRFKVCVNNNPEILELKELSCSRQMFPSFIKKENDTSDKPCDEIGGKLYKQGYTYGDYHEFKDLDIEVCFNEKDKTNLCTNPNLNGNETDYRSEERQGSGTRMQSASSSGNCGNNGGAGCGNIQQLCRNEGSSTDSSVACTANEVACNGQNGKYPRGKFKASTPGPQGTQYCGNINCGCCIDTNRCRSPNTKFTTRHVCADCITNGVSKDTPRSALKWITNNQDRRPDIMMQGRFLTVSTVFSNAETAIVYKNDPDHRSWCRIKNLVLTWECRIDFKENGDRYWEKCSLPQQCAGSYDKDKPANEGGHFEEGSLKPAGCLAFVYQ